MCICTHGLCKFTLFNNFVRFALPLNFNKLTLGFNIIGKCSRLVISCLLFMLIFDVRRSEVVN